MYCPHCGKEITTNDHVANLGYGQVNVAGAAPAFIGTSIVLNNGNVANPLPVAMLNPQPLSVCAGAAACAGQMTIKF